MSEFKHIRYEVAGNAATVVLNRPPVNILNIEMMEEMNRAFETASSEPGARIVVVRGEGKCFSAGVDVGEHTDELAPKMIEVFHRMFHILAACPKPVVAVVHGSALGGGCELLAFCDLVVARDDAKIGQPEIQVGVFPPVAAALFPDMLGAKKAFELILTGAVLSAADAEAAGLVNRVIPGEGFEEGAGKFLGRLTGLSGPVLALAKKALRAGTGSPGLGGLEEIENIYLGELMKTRDANEGLQAFLEKRRPVWEDR
jgi:cyclohexa-1,5-dienecarbonyl-CoA hydratase